MEYTYEEFINNILETRGRFACGNEYHERHHILPKCLGGNNDEENLIDLFAKEHFEAHRLLALENPDDYKLVYAWNMMCNSKNSDYKITEKEYEEARKHHANAMSGENNPNYGKIMSEDQRKKLSESKIGNKHPNWGKHLSEDTRKKMSLAATGKGNPFYGKHLSEYHKKKISNAMQGEKNHFYGKHHSEETKKKISEANKGNNIKKVIQYGLNGEIIKIWDSIIKAEKHFCLNNCISPCCRGKQETAGGYHWKYLYDQTRKDGTIVPGAITLGLITEEEALKQLEKQEGD